MNDSSSAASRDARRDWVTEHREMYVRSGGTEIGPIPVFKESDATGTRPF